MRREMEIHRITTCVFIRGKGKEWETGITIDDEIIVDLKGNRVKPYDCQERCDRGSFVAIFDPEQQF